MARTTDSTRLDLDIDGLAAELGRRDTPERLSADARQRLFATVTGPSQPGPLAVLFTPIRRLAWAAVLPAVVLGVVLVGVADRGGELPTSPQTRVFAEKVGGEVVFRIANGGGAHHVSRAETPDGFAADSSTVAVRGEFRDRLADGSDLVFYRID